MASYGGAFDDGGVIFRIGPKRKYEVLYNFYSLANCADGKTPDYITLGPDGRLYGATGQGGAHNFGTLFVFTP